MRIHYRIVLLGACAVGCGGSTGGVNDNELLVDLTQSQLVSLCNQFVSEFPQKMTTCGSGVTVTVGDTGSDCTGSAVGSNNFPSSCTATVGDAENCLSAEYDNPCALGSGDIPPACDPVIACEGSD